LARFSEDTKAGMPDFVSNWEIYTILAISLSLFQAQKGSPLLPDALN
jgi:hypothetical protein